MRMVIKQTKMELMKISQKGLELIKKFESCKLHAYRDSVGVPTIGWGHTNGVRMGMAVSQEQADKYLLEDITSVERTLNSMGINFKQQQFDALCSWVFNLGSGRLKSSTMYKFIVAKRSDVEITDQLIKWHYAGNKPLLGLKRRRVAEANMWLGMDLYYIDTTGGIKKKQ